MNLSCKLYTTEVMLIYIQEGRSVGPHYPLN